MEKVRWLARTPENLLQTALAKKGREQEIYTAMLSHMLPTQPSSCSHVVCSAEQEPVSSPPAFQPTSHCLHNLVKATNSLSDPMQSFGLNFRTSMLPTPQKKAVI